MTVCCVVTKMIYQSGLSKDLYLLILLPGIFAHICWCAHLINYNEYLLENEKICNYAKKQYTHEIRNGTAAIVKTNHVFDRWINRPYDLRCKFTFKTSHEGLFAVIDNMFFRQNGTYCIDYVRFRKTDGYLSPKICGEIDHSGQIYQLVSDPNLYNKSQRYAEFEPVHQSKIELETEIFVSKERTIGGQILNISIVYTPYKDCKTVNLEQYTPVGHNCCIRNQYICDKVYNCPLNVCSDEKNCSYKITDLLPREDTATEVTVGAITTVILCFIIFIMCLWICKRSQKLCWSSDCAGPNVCSRPSSLPQDLDGLANRGVSLPTAPMLEVAVSSPVANKDLPPSYDSLFPEQSNPARS